MQLTLSALSNLSDVLYHNEMIPCIVHSGIRARRNAVSKVTARVSYSCRNKKAKTEMLLHDDVAIERLTAFQVDSGC